MLTLLGANEMELGLDPGRFDLFGGEGRLDRNVLAIPDVLPPADQPAALRLLLDLVWQAAGMERSFNYYAAGKWVAQ